MRWENFVYLSIQWHCRNAAVLSENVLHTNACTAAACWLKDKAQMTALFIYVPQYPLQSDKPVRISSYRLVMSTCRCSRSRSSSWRGRWWAWGRIPRRLRTRWRRWGRSRRSCPSWPRHHAPGHLGTRELIQLGSGINCGINGNYKLHFIQWQWTVDCTCWKFSYLTNIFRWWRSLDGLFKCSK